MALQEYAVIVQVFRDMCHLTVLATKAEHDGGTPLVAGSYLELGRCGVGCGLLELARKLPHTGSSQCQGVFEVPVLFDGQIVSDIGQK